MPSSKPSGRNSKRLSKVVWSEGMYLSSHHFQAQRQSFEDLIQFVSLNLWFSPFGFAGFALDAEKLRNGNIALSYARGIFPDGLVFDMPESDAFPEPRRIGDSFPPTHEFLNVYLAVPVYNSQGPNCSLVRQNSSPRARYVPEEKSFADENTGEEQRPVQFGRKNVFFALEGELSDSSSALPIARILRDGSGNYVYDAAFIPPCIQIGASERLLVMLRRLIEILDEKSATLSPFRSAGAQFKAGFSSGDVASFWFVHTINSSLGVLRHIYQTERGHPQQVFTELSRLAGALCTFGIESHPQTLPAYNHLDLGRCFSALDAHIRTHLELVLPSNCVAVPMHPTGRNEFQGEITDQRCLGPARWVLAIRSSVGELDLISRAPRQVKISSADLLPELVKTSLPGLALTHLPVPPTAIAPKVEFQYFGISRTGSAWDHVVQSRKVGLHVPGDFPNAEVELSVILDS